MSPEVEGVGQLSRALLHHPELDGHLVPVAHRAEEVARGGDSGHPPVSVGVPTVGGAAEGPIEGVLRLLHPPEERGEVRQAGGIGVGELDAVELGEFVGHARKVNGVWDGGARGRYRSFTRLNSSSIRFANVSKLWIPAR